MALPLYSASHHLSLPFLPLQHPNTTNNNIINFTVTKFYFFAFTENRACGISTFAKLSHIEQTGMSIHKY